MIIIKYPNVQYPQLSNSSLDLMSLRTLVKGDIDIVFLKKYFSKKEYANIALVVKDDGAIDNKSKPNIRFGKTTLYGNIVACGVTRDGDLRDLKPSEVVIVDDFFQIHSISDRAFSTPQDLFGVSMRK